MKERRRFQRRVVARRLKIEKVEIRLSTYRSDVAMVPTWTDGVHGAARFDTQESTHILHEHAVCYPVHIVVPLMKNYVFCSCAKYGFLIGTSLLRFEAQTVAGYATIPCAIVLPRNLLTLRP